MYWMRGIFTTVILYINSERGLGARDLEKGRRGMDLERCAGTIWQLFLVYCMTQRRGRFSFFFRLWDEKSKILRRLLCGINKMGLGVWHVQDSMVVWQRLTETSWKCRLKCHWAVEGVLYCIICKDCILYMETRRYIQYQHQYPEYSICDICSWRSTVILGLSYLSIIVHYSKNRVEHSRFVSSPNQPTNQTKRWNWKRKFPNPSSRIPERTSLGNDEDFQSYFRTVLWR